MTFIAFLIFVSPININAQAKNTKAETFHVSGNCGMCKKTIETASNEKGISKAEWNVENKTLAVSFDSTKTTSDEILPGCCQYDRASKETSMAMLSDHKTVQEETQNPTEKAQVLDEVFNGYFALKDALTNDDGVKAASQAKRLYKAIDDADMKAMKTDQHMVWMKLMKKLSYDAEHIKGVTETEHQREHFASLSVNMYEVMKVFKTSSPVYYQFCPMAEEGKGANWLSLDEKINNPYMGKKMPTCGKTVETIK